jgi:hypothetical protein
MTSSLYRRPASARLARHRGRRADRDLLPAAALLWAVSLIRTVAALLWHEKFGAEATLALMAVVGLPWLFFGAMRREKT